VLCLGEEIALLSEARERMEGAVVANPANESSSSRRQGKVEGGDEQ
jgi:hypothetical protein